MSDAISVRFKSAAAALRFYFRAEEVLSANASLHLYPEGRIAGTADNRRENLLLDYLSIAACLKDLNQLQLWLLRELYSPARLGQSPRGVSRACEAGRKIFPRVRWTVQGVGRLHRYTLGLLEDRLARKRLIPSLQPTVCDSCETAFSTVSHRTRQGGDHGFRRFEERPRGFSLNLGADASEHARPCPSLRAPHRRREVIFDHSRPRH